MLKVLRFKVVSSVNEWWEIESILQCKLKCYVKPMKDQLGVSSSKGNQGTTRGTEKILLNSFGVR